MVWANSILLAIGGLLVTVPIILHLLMQPKPKPLVFPALRFVQQNQSTNQRRMRLRHWILLALRGLLILILAAALAGPSTASNKFGSWVTTGLFLFAAVIVASLLAATLFSPSDGNTRTKRVLVPILAVLLTGLLAVGGYSMVSALRSNDGPIIGDQRAPVAAALIVDTSPRMEYLFENETSLSRAVTTGEWLVEQFPLDSQVAIMSAEEDSPFFSVDLQSAKNRLKILKTDFEVKKLPGKIEQALEFLHESPLQRRELYVLTDMTAKSWSSNNSDSLATIAANYKDVTIYVIDVGPPATANFSIDEIILQQNSITAKDDFEIQCRIFHQSVSEGPDAKQDSSDAEDVSRNIRLRIEKPDPLLPVRRDGKTQVPEQYLAEREINVTLKNNGSSAASFNIGQLPEGTHHGVIQIIGKDGLSVDDQRFFTVEVKPAWPVIMTTTRNVSANYLQSCLEASATSYDQKVIDQVKLDREDLQQFRAIFMLDPLPPSDATWQRLTRYVEKGGSVAIFLGPNSADGQKPSTQMLTSSALKFLPGAISEIWRRPMEDPVYLNPGSLNHPILAGFRRASTLVPWTKLPVFWHWGLRELNDDEVASIEALQSSEVDSPMAKDSVEVILRYSNAMPAVIEKKIGLGKVILLTTPISEPPKNLDENPWNFLRNGVDGDTNVTWATFVLIRMLGEYLVSNTGGSLNYQLGQTASLQNERQLYPDRYRMFAPRDEDPSVINAEDGRLRYRFTNLPGHYRLKAAESGTVLLRGFSVNFGDRTTDMTQIDRTSLDEIIGKDRFSFATNRDEIQREQGAMRIGREFYPLLMLLLAIILIVELLFSNFFYAQPSAMGIQQVA